jgi:hypothetical protein
MAECLQTQCVDAGVVLGAGVAFDLKRGGCLIVLCFSEPWEEEWWFCVVF